MVIGGTSLFGGMGSIVGSVIGTFIPTVLRNGLIIGGINPFWQQVTIGAILIAAVLSTADRIPSLSGKVVSGRLDVARAITFNAGGTTPPPAADTTGATVTNVAFTGSGNFNSRSILAT